MRHSRAAPIGQCTPAGPARLSCGQRLLLVGRPPTVGLATTPNPACVREEAGDNPLNDMQLAGSARPDALADAGCCRGARRAMAPTEHLGARPACRRYPPEACEGRNRSARELRALRPRARRLSWPALRARSGVRQARNRHADRGSNAAFASSRPKDRTVLYGFGDSSRRKARLMTTV